MAFTSPDQVRDPIHNFNADGFESLRPKYAGGRPPKFDPEQREQIKQIALARPTDHGLPFSTWSLSNLGGAEPTWQEALAALDDAFRAAD